MAKKRRGKASIAGYFRPFFEENPALLESTDNDELVERWKQDHPKHTARRLRKVRQGLANLKSQLRKREREKLSAGAKAPRANAVVMVLETAASPLVQLEDRIDEAMFLARRIDRAGLETAIHHLRLARNEVVARLP